MNLLRNAPLFGYGLFPDAAIVTAEQDIQKHETSSVAQRPGPGAPHLMNVGIRKPLLPLITQTNNNNNLGDSLVGVVSEAMGLVEVPILVSPSLTSTNHINDNYFVSPTSFQVNQLQLDLSKVQKEMCSGTQFTDKLVSRTVSQPVFSKTINSVVSQTLKLDVSCHAVTRAHIVPLHGLPQRKGLSPDHSMNKIKHVKGVCCVNPCLFVPPVLNVPNAVI